MTRVWHGRTRREDADVYRHYVIDTGVPDYLKTNGNLGVEIWQREEGDLTHIWTVTQWQDLECIKSFAGEDLEKARYYPDDTRYLVELEPNVIHCQTISFSNASVKGYIRQLEQLYGGGSWNGESFIEKLKDMDENMHLCNPCRASTALRKYSGTACTGGRS